MGRGRSIDDQRTHRVGRAEAIEPARGPVIRLPVFGWRLARVSVSDAKNAELYADGIAWVGLRF